MQAVIDHSRGFLQMDAFGQVAVHPGGGFYIMPDLSVCDGLVCAVAVQRIPC